MDLPTIVRVHELTRYIKSRLEADPSLRDVWVRGELSNFKHHTSGHMYFTLKDDRAQIRCVMFRSENAGLAFAPENGLQVVVRARIGVYERDGNYQLYVQAMEPHGRGALHLAFEQLKARLAAEGLFDLTRKRRLPRLPRRIGVVTSPTGAAIRDIIRVTRRRFANVTLVVAPVLVQGEEAPAQIASAVRLLDRHGEVDVIIVGRGGGSFEDLWAFNDERVARAVHASEVPVVAAVGHQTDTTIVDFVADVSAATPSAAAEMVVPSRGELIAALSGLRARLIHGLHGRLQVARSRCDRVTNSQGLKRPLERIQQERQRVDQLWRRLCVQAERGIERYNQRLQGLAGRLDALSPLAILDRGYGIVRRRDDGRLVCSVASVVAGDQIDVRVRDGNLFCSIGSVMSRSLPATEGVSDVRRRVLPGERGNPRGEEDGRGAAG